MLYWIAEALGFPGALNLIRYLSFRTGGAVAKAPDAAMRLCRCVVPLRG